jgi:hypothetical protein
MGVTATVPVLPGAAVTKSALIIGRRRKGIDGVRVTDTHKAHVDPRRDGMGSAPCCDIDKCGVWFVGAHTT